MSNIKSIALVDASHRLSVNFHAYSNEVGPNQAASSTIRDLVSIRDYAQHVIVCVDRGPYWRHEIFPEYKAGRERDPQWPIIYADFMNLLELEGFNVAGHQGYEADDIMATLARYYASACGDIRLITEDKDALQLLTPNVSVHCWRPRGEFEVRGLEWLKTYEKMGATKKSAKGEAQPAVTPEQVPLLQAIMGDKGDNIKGVDGIGPVQGAAFIRKFWKGEPLATIAAITDACVGLSTGAKVPAVVSRWLAGCGEVGRWVQLTTLRDDVPLDPTDLLEYRAPKPLVVEDGGGILEEDPELERIFADIHNDVNEPDAEELAEEAAAMAGHRPAEDYRLDPAEEVDIISAPPKDAWDVAKDEFFAMTPEAQWLEFKTNLGAKLAVGLAGLQPDAPYRLELLHGYRVMRNGTRPLTECAAHAYKGVKTPGERNLDKALPKKDHNEERAADKKHMAELADKVLPLPKAKASSVTPVASVTAAAAVDAPKAVAPGVVPPAASTGTSAGKSDPKAPSVDASTPSADGTSTAPESSQPRSQQEKTSAPGAAHTAEVVPNGQGPTRPVPGQRVEKSIDESALGIVAYPAPSWALSCEPASAGHTITIATRLWGRVEFLKSKFPTPEAMAFTILHGRNLGLGLAISLMEIWVIRGRPSCSSRLISALAQQDPNHEYTQMVDLTETFCKVLVKDKRMKDPTPWTYSIEEAEAISLTKPSPKTGEKSQWVLRPKTMLLKTAAVIGHRFMFPGRVLGLHPIELEPEGQHIVTE